MASFLLASQPGFDLSAARLPASRNLSKSAAVTPPFGALSAGY